MSSKTLDSLPIPKHMVEFIILALIPCIKTLGDTRNSDITGKVLSGVPTDVIADEYGITIQRVRQICISTIRKALYKASQVSDIEEVMQENRILKARIASLECSVNTYLKNLDNFRLCIGNSQRTLIDHTSITIRLSNVIKSVGIEFWEDFSSMTETQLLRYRNFGRKSLMELEDILTTKGIQLKQQTI
ncbi:MAG: hypothetical protein NC411_00265 [Bacteroides sp.]|nr:hypothetical protein [Bacteroides sp.]